MRLGTVKSELIAKIGFSGGPGDRGVLQVEYKDGAVFNYENVPYHVFRKLATAKHPGQEWLKTRDRYKFAEV